MVGLPMVMFPVITSTCFLLMVVVCYILAVSFDHVAPLWPFVSNLGIYYPESCVTTFLSCLAAATGIPSVFLRYQYILRVEKKLEILRPYIIKTAKVSAIFMFVAFIGLLFNGCFQRFEPDRLHTIGGIMLFGCGFVSCTLDCFITIRQSSGAWCNFVKILRILLAVVLPISGSISIFSKIISENILSNALPNITASEYNYKQLHWDQSLPGYDYFLFSSFNELIAIFIYFAYVCSLAYEFKGLSVDFILRI